MDPISLLLAAVVAIELFFMHRRPAGGLVTRTKNAALYPSPSLDGDPILLPSPETALEPAGDPQGEWIPVRVPLGSAATTSAYPPQPVDVDPGVTYWTRERNFQGAIA